MSAETVELPEGVTLVLLRIGLIQRKVEETAERMHALSEEISELVCALVPDAATTGSSADRDAWWEAFTEAVDTAAERREASHG